MSMLHKLPTLLKAIRFEHTAFALPFALTSACDFTVAQASACDCVPVMSKDSPNADPVWWCSRRLGQGLQA